MPVRAPRPVERRDAPGESARMFFALRPDAGARAALAILAHAVARKAGGRAPAAENLHLTLAFVGEVAVGRIAALREIGRRVAMQVSPFSVVLDRLGAFRDGGIAWIGTTDVPSALADMAARLARGLAAEGFRVDARPYAPHLTLARRCRKFPADAGAARIAWDVGELALVESVLRPGGPAYRDDARWPLAARVAAGGS